MRTCIRVVSLLSVIVCAASVEAELLYSIDPRSSDLRRIDPANASTLQNIPMTLAGVQVEGGTGLALHPQTLELWALLRTGTQFRELVTLNPTTGAAQSVGTTEVEGLSALAFAGDGTLYAVTGDGGMPPETLFRLSTTDASSTLVLPLGAGNDGEALAFNPDDGRMYHASGIAGDCPSPLPGDGVCFESIDLGTLQINDIDVRGTALTLEEAFALTYRESQGVLLWSQGGPTPQLYSVTAEGSVALIGPFEEGHASKGLAILNRVPTDDFELTFSSSDELSWPVVPCATEYNVYRLVAPRLIDLDDDGAADDHGSCFQSSLTENLSIDSTDPGPGQTQFYLVTAENDLGEAGLGQGSGQVPRPNLAPCP